MAHDSPLGFLSDLKLTTLGRFPASVVLLILDTGGQDLAGERGVYCALNGVRFLALNVSSTKTGKGRPGVHILPR